MRRSIAVILFVSGSALACGGSDSGPNPPATSVLAVSAGNNQIAPVNTLLANPLCAVVTSGGSAKADVTVNWSSTTAGVAAASSISGSGGVACTDVTTGTAAGTQTVQAAVSGATGSPVTFSISAVAGAAFSITGAGGDNQSASISTVLPLPLTVLIADQFGNPVQNAQVGWSVISGSATVAPPFATTLATGIASTTVTLGGTAGPIVINATSSGLNGSPLRFDATATVPPPLPTAITITVQNNSFSPAVDTVAAGGTVTWDWANTAGVQHSVTSTSNPTFTSDPAGLTASPHSYGPITFSTPGTYFYYCEVHGAPGSPPTGMSGRIVVQ